jgi:hypothetical protein
MHGAVVAGVRVVLVVAVKAQTRGCMDNMEAIAEASLSLSLSPAPPFSVFYSVSWCGRTSSSGQPCRTLEARLYPRQPTLRHLVC